MKPAVVLLLSCEAEPKQSFVTSVSSLGIFVVSLTSTFGNSIELLSKYQHFASSCINPSIHFNPIISDGI